MIEPIVPEHLEPEVFAARVRPDLTRTHYWTDRWDPGFYARLAYEGFIAISHRRPTVLIPELQRSYAVLDWPRLHESRHVRRLRRSGRLERERVELVVSPDPRPVMDALVAYHGRRCWLTEPYRSLMCLIADGRGAGGPADRGLVVCGSELRGGPERELVAGELGYTIGRTYTSLTGFCRPEARQWRHFGTLQLVLLGERLRDAGYAFWNLGHPGMAYKKALGAEVVPRERFLRRWCAHRDETPDRDLFEAAR
jgi:hypothetical protein